MGIPGSSRYVKIMASGKFFLVKSDKAQILNTWKIQVYIYIMYIYIYPPGNKDIPNYSNLGKGKASSKVPLKGDMLVLRRVHVYICFSFGGGGGPQRKHRVHPACCLAACWF